MAYEPKPQVEWIHDSTNRFGGTNDPDFSSSASTEDYMTGVVGNVALLVILGVLSTLIITVMQFVCCCCRKNPVMRLQATNGGAEGASRAIRAIQRNRIIFVVLAVIIGGLAMGGIGTTAGLAKGMTDTVDVMLVAADKLEFVQNKQSEVTDGANLAIEGAQAMPAAVRSACQSQRPQSVPTDEWNRQCQEAEQEAQEVADSAQAALDAVSAADVSMGDNIREIRDLHSDASGPADPTRMGASAAIALFSLAAILLGVTLLPCGLCGCLFKLAHIWNTWFIVPMWVVCAAVFALAIVAGDVCYDPVTLVLDNVGSGDAAETIQYYLTCNDPAVRASPVGAYSEVLSANTSIGEAISFRSALYTTLQDMGIENDAGVSAEYAKIHDGVDQAVDAVAEVVEEAACALLNDVWMQLLDGMCGTFVPAAIGFWGVMTASALMLSFMLCHALTFWNGHPSRISDLRKYKEQQQTAAGVQMTAVVAGAGAANAPQTQAAPAASAPPAAVPAGKTT
jgi:hypothetical protein